MVAPTVPRMCGRATLTMLESSAPMSVPKVIDTGYYWYDKTNMNDPKIAAVLYD